MVTITTLLVILPIGNIPILNAIPPLDSERVEAATDDTIIKYEDIKNVNLDYSDTGYGYTFDSSVTSFTNIRYDSTTKRLYFTINGFLGTVGPKEYEYGQFGFTLNIDYSYTFARNEYWDSYHNKTRQTVEFWTTPGYATPYAVFNGSEVGISFPYGPPSRFRISASLTSDFGTNYIGGATLVDVPLERKNTVPSTPTISVPSFTSGDKPRISWTPSTDSDGDNLTYQLEVSYNNRSTWTQIYHNSDLYYDYTVPTNQNSVVFRVRAYDGKAYSDYATSSSFVIDFVSPIGMLTAGTTSWTNGNITITATGSDTGSGFKRIQKPDGTYVASASTTYTVSANGTYTFVFEDNAGNVTTKSITVSNIDKTNPTGTLTASPTTWTNGTVTITATGSDASGINRIKRPDGIFGLGSTTTYSITANGTYTFVFEDNAGNTLSKNITISNIDKTAPTVAFTPEEQKSSFTDIEVQLGITDQGGSGFKHYRYVWSKEQTYPTESWSDWDTESKPLLMQKKSGKWILHIEARDAVGNLSYAKRGIYEKLASGGPSINLNVTPAPTGVWSNKSLTAYILESGDAELLANANKMYEVTNSSATPNSFTKVVPIGKKITLNLVGENFVHVQYVLEDGTKMTSSSGPYLMDTSDVGNFTMKLVNIAGVEVTTWSKEALKLVMGNPSTTSVSGYTKQYRIKGVHTEWQTYRDGITINLEGKNRIFGRIVNGANVASEQQVVTSNVDLTPPTVQQVRLITKENGRYEVSVQANDAASGVKEVLLNNGATLTKNGQTYLSNVLTTKPIAVTVKDQAGNVTSAIPFEAEPTITFSGGYSPTLSSYRGDVTVAITGATRYLVGTKEYLCAQSNCQFTIKSNTTITAIRENGTSETHKVIAMTNIDKTPLALVLNGKRNVIDPMKIEFQWNYALADAQLICYEAGVQKTFTVNGKAHSFAGKNVVYDCTVNGVYAGEALQSNHIKIFTDATIETGGSVLIQEIPKKNNVHIDQTAAGDAYMINAKSDNYKETQLPFPKDLLVPKTNP